MQEFGQIVLRRRLRRRYPAGLIAGMLAGSLATILGVVCGNDPFAICMRASISAVLVGATIAIGVSLVRVANLEPERRRNRST